MNKRLAVPFLILLLTSAVLASIPQQMSYQGRLKNSSGTPQTGSYSVLFTIYDAASGGTDLWHETQTVTCESGLFSVLLGSGTAIGASVLDGTDRWLGVKVGSDAEMTPRQKLVSVANAYKASDSDNLGGHPASYFATATGGNYVQKAGDTMTGALSIDAGTADPALRVRTASNTLEALYVSGNGRVGIGTTSPGSTLDINGTPTIRGDWIYLNPTSTTALFQGIALRSNYAGGTGVSYLDARRPTGTIDSHIWFRHSSDNSSMIDIAVSPSGADSDRRATAMIIDSTGKVGIGTTTPSYPLHVSKSTASDWMVGLNNPSSGAGSVYLSNGNGEGAAVVAGSSLGAASYAFKVDKGATNYFYVKGDGNTGIGTTSPAYPLEVSTATDWNGFAVRETSNNNAGAAIRVIKQRGTGNASNGDYAGGIEYNVKDSGGNIQNIAAIHALAPSVADGSETGQLHFYTRNGATWGDRVTIDQSGNFGIGTTSPSQLLHLRKDGDWQLMLQNANAGGGYWNIGQSDNSWITGGGKLLFTPDSIASANAKVVFTNTGNVGIGTTEPQYLLHLYSSGTYPRMYFQGNAGNYPGIMIGFDPSGSRSSVIRANAIGTDGTDLQLWTKADGGSLGQRLTISNAGNVGIGTTSPAQKLSVAGTIEITSGSGGGLKFADGTIQTTAGGGGSQWTTSGSDIYYNNGGNVGIGTASPFSKLNIAGINSYVINDNYSNDTAGAAFIGRKARGTPTSPSAPQADDGMTSILARGYGATGWGANNVGGFMVYASENFSDSAQGTYLTLGTTPNGTITRQERMRITNAGNVGIGTASPEYQLEIDNGAASPVVLLKSASDTDSNRPVWAIRRALGTLSSPTTVGNNTFLGTLNAQGYNGTDYRAAASLDFYVDGGLVSSRPKGSIRFSLGDASGNLSEMMRINSAGNVGLGTASPATRLEVFDAGNYARGISLNSSDSSGNSTRLFFNSAIETGNKGFAILKVGTGSTNRLAFQYNASPEAASGSTAMSILTGGNVGIGTAEPQAKLHLLGNGWGSAVRMTNDTAGSNWNMIAADGGDFEFRMNNSDKVMTMKQTSGNVGVGTTSPAQKLSVAGTIEITSGSGGGLKFADGTILTTASGSGGSSQWVTTGSNIYYNSGYVAIGTTESPTSPLVVNGAVVTSDPAGGYALTSGTTRSRRFGLKYGSAGNAGDSDLLMLTNREANGELAFATNSGTAGAAGEVERMRITNAGNVGIGTAEPSALLNVRKDQDGGTMLAVDNFYTASSANQSSSLYVRSADGTGAMVGGVGLISFGTNTTGTLSGFNKAKSAYLRTAAGAPADRLVIATGTSVPIHFSPNDTPVVTMLPAGNVGIGTTSPAQKLSVAGTIEITSGGGLKFADGTIQSTASGSGAWSAGSGTIYATNASDKIAIGGASPLAPLDVRGAGATNNMYNLAYFAANTDPGTDANIYSVMIDKQQRGTLALGVNKSTVTGSIPGNCPFISTWASSTPLSIGRGNNGLPNSADIFIAANTGNVGIGTASPAARLEVGGTDDTPQNAAILNTRPSFPQLIFNATNGGSNAKLWRLIGRSSGVFEIQTLNDSYTGENTAMQINRSGTTISNVLFPGGVGIGGATSPGNFKLAIGNSAQGAGGNLFVSSGGNTRTGILMSDGDHNSLWLMTGANSDSIIGLDGKNLTFKTGVTYWSGPDSTGTDRMTIMSGGNIGIGTTSPASLLTVQKNTAGGRGGELSIVNPAAPTVGNEAALNFGVEGSTYDADNGNGQIKMRLVNAANSASDMIFSTWNGSAFGERMRIQSGGKVGIGTSEAWEPLDVASATGRMIVSDGGGADRRALLLIAPTASVDYGRIEAYGYGASGLGKRLYINNVGRGNVAIATTDATSQLTVNGTIEITAGSGGGLKFADGTILTTASGGGGSSQWTTTGSDIYYNSGNVGIGTTSPSVRLHILGTGNSTTSELKLQNATTGSGDNTGTISMQESSTNLWTLAKRSSGWTSGRANAFDISYNDGSWHDYFTINSSGNVGLGTTNPGYALDIASAANDGGMRITGSGTGGPWLFFNTTGASRYTGMNLLNNGTSQWQISLRGGDGSLHIFDTVNSLDRVVVRSNGNVGIGTASPSTELSVVDGSFNGARQLLEVRNSNTGSNAQSEIGFYTGNDVWAQGAPTYFAIGKLASSNGGYPDMGYVWNTKNGGFMIGTNNMERFRVTSAGNVGIGTTNPTRTLEVNGIIKATAFEGAGQWGVNGSDMYYNSGKVGIGTSSPGAKLELSDNTSEPWLFFSNTSNGSSSNTGGIQFKEGTNNHWDIAKRTSGFTGQANSLLFNYYSGSWINPLTLTTTARVGINNVAPSAALDVVAPSTTGYASLFALHNTGYEPWLFGADSSSSNNLNISSNWDRFNLYLDMNNDGGSSRQFAVYEGVAVGSGTPTLKVSGGKVSIGTASMGQTLTINSTDSAKLGLTGGTTQNGMAFGANNGADNAYLFNGLYGAIPVQFGIWDSTASAPRLFIMNSGYTGIGTVEPVARLHVYSATSEGVFIGKDGSNRLNLSYDAPNGDAYITSNSSITGGYSDLIVRGNPIKLNDNNTSNVLLAGGGGNVGIGTTNPTRTLEVNGIIKATAFEGAGLWGVNGSDLYYNSGNVGIGTAGPLAKLHVVGSNGFIFNDNYSADISGGAFIGRKARGSIGSPSAMLANDQLTGLFGRGYGATGFGSINTAALIMYASENYTDSAQGTYMTFGTTLNGTTSRSERMRIDNAGNVGIGTTSPGYTLEVNGLVKATTGFLTPRTAFLQDAANNTVVYNDGTGGGVWLMPYPSKGILLGKDLATVNSGGGAHNFGIDASTGTLYWNALSSNADVSLYRSAASTLRTNSTFIADGSLGIGATPNRTLTLQKGDGNGNVVMSLNNTSGTVKAFMGVIGATDNYASPGAVGDTFVRAEQDLQIATSTSGLTRMTVKSGGSVGIGTAEPQATLHVYNTGGANSSIFVGPTSVNRLNLSFDTAIMSGVITGYSTSDYSSVILRAKPFIVNDNNNGKILLGVGGGYVGVGTTEPLGALHVANNGNIWVTNSNNDSGRIFVHGTMNYFGLRSSNVPIRLETDGGTNRVYIENSTGRVGINTTTPGYILDVQHASEKVNSKNGYLTNGADYAEYFENEETVPAGALVGVNLASGRVRVYREGDEYIGIATTAASAGYVGNSNKAKESDPGQTLVGLLGQLDLKSDTAKIVGRVVYTPDMKKVGILLSNNKVFVGK